MSVAARLAQIRKLLGLSQKDMGKRVGVSGTTWQNYELENASPNAHVLAKLSSEGFNMNWVLTGAGEMRSGAAPETKSAGFAELMPRELGRDELGGAGKYVLVPRYTLRTLERDKGGAVTMEDLTLLETMSFRRDFIERELKTDAAHLIAVEAADDAMAPTFRQGDILLADTSEPRLRGSGIYVFASGGALIVKRMQVKLDGGVVVSSDNAERDPPEEIEREALDRVKIVGRVIWRGGRL